MTLLLNVHVPTSYAAERAYAIQLLLSRFLGQPVHLVAEERTNTVIRLDGAPNTELILEDGLFATNVKQWLLPSTIPVGPLPACQPPEIWPSQHADLPVFFGARLPSGQFIKVSERTVQFGIDLLGGAFFLLTRYEELARSSHDAHARFPAAASLLFREKLLRRPIVNEYVELMWAALHHLWPHLRRPHREYRVMPTHDVDRPFCVYRKSIGHVARQVVGDVVRRHEPSLAVRRVDSMFRVRRDGARRDICNNFDWIMQQSEARGLRSAFYFLCQTGAEVDSDYDFDDSPILQLFNEIHHRGHEIGLHPSYQTFRSADRIADEFSRLRSAVERLGVSQPVWGGRQHYLRWEVPITWQNWADAGLDYDSTVGFADAAGFRCGTCFEFPVFNLRSRQQLKLQERPLIAMEETLLAPEYEGLSHARALQVMRELADECRYYRGDFLFLWHNSRLLSAVDRQTYTSVLDYAVGENSAPA